MTPKTAEHEPEVVAPADVPEHVKRAPKLELVIKETLKEFPGAEVHMNNAPPEKGKRVVPLTHVLGAMQRHVPEGLVRIGRE